MFIYEILGKYFPRNYIAVHDVHISICESFRVNERGIEMSTPRQEKGHSSVNRKWNAWRH